MTLPDLQALTVNDDRLRGRAADPDAVRSALAHGESNLQAALASADPRQIARSLGYCAEAERLLDDFDAAERRVREALDIARALHDERLTRANTIRLGELARSCGNSDAAIRLLDGARQAAAADPDRYLLDFALQHLGKALWNAGRPHEAIPLLEQALDLRRKLCNPGLIASTQEALAAARRSTVEIDLSQRVRARPDWQ